MEKLNRAQVEALFAADNNVAAIRAAEREAGKA